MAVGDVPIHWTYRSTHHERAARWLDDGWAQIGIHNLWLPGLGTEEDGPAGSP